MSKKSKKKNKPENKKASHAHADEIKGILFTAAALILFLSLLSFSLHGAETHNWLGLMGYTLGWSFVALFGFGSYLVCLFAGWIGLRLLRKKQPLNLLFKTTCFTLTLVSACVLLSLLEERYPDLATQLSGLLHSASGMKKVRFHLGGAPFAYLYKDLPHYNFLYLFNAAGSALLFSCLLIGSLYLLSPFSFVSSLQQLAAKMKVLFPLHKKAETGEEEESIFTPPAEEKKKITFTPPQTKEQESTFMRYVKLRIPGFPIPQTGQSVGESGVGKPNEMLAEMLAIQPETELKSRPSLSKKIQNDKPETATKSRKQELQEAAAPKMIAPPPRNQERNQEREPEPARQRRETALSAQRVHNGDFTDYKLPALSLLTQAKKLDHSIVEKRPQTQSRGAGRNSFEFRHRGQSGADQLRAYHHFL